MFEGVRVGWAGGEVAGGRGGGGREGRALGRIAVGVCYKRGARSRRCCYKFKKNYVGAGRYEWPAP